MAERFDFVRATDRPALIAFSNPEWLEMTRSALIDLGYKVHTAATHGDFMIRFNQVRYQVIVIEELFCANTREENVTLKAIQQMPMNQRRHATVILVGESYQTFTPLEAFRESVHAVVNPSELFLMKQLIEKAVTDNEMFYSTYRMAQERLRSGASRG